MTAVRLDPSAAEGMLTRRPVREQHFETHDGVALFYRHWPAQAAQRRGAIVLLHRGHEHSGRIAHLALPSQF